MQNTYNPSNLEALFKQFLLVENVQSESYNTSLQSNTIRNYLSDLRFFFGWLARYSMNKPNPVNATHEDIVEYRSYLIESNLPYRTINRRLSTVRKFYSFCIDQIWIRINPANNIENVKTTSSHTISDVDQASLLQEYEAYLASQYSQQEAANQKSIITEFMQNV